MDVGTQLGVIRCDQAGHAARTCTQPQVVDHSASSSARQPPAAAAGGKSGGGGGGGGAFLAGRRRLPRAPPPAAPLPLASMRASLVRKSSCGEEQGEGPPKAVREAREAIEGTQRGWL